ncbi:A24 family peptidase [Pararhizobium sp.]|uniref:A24 family peptidase n=1 Tax=Pararhizobium sp. TaxID=1977563 RepID=UPI003D123CF0
MTEAAIFVIFPLCLAFAAFSDLFTMTIPNRISAILLGSFLIVAPFAGLNFASIGMHIIAGLVVFTACFTLFAFNIMGGGDAKLLTASAVWFGFNSSLIEFITWVSIFGGVLTLAILVMRKQEDAILMYGLPVPQLLLTATKVPYGIAIGFGAFFAYPSSPLMQVALGQMR